MDSVLTLRNMVISVRDHTTVSRRAVGLMIMKPKSVLKGPLHMLIDSTGLQVFGANDGAPTYQIIAQHGDDFALQDRRSRHGIKC
ncbi:MAG: transposase [Undibacterium sp.]|uniref:transposase n=1 Tax=Undibacterium sp. TaxID=1914977 RepID=UPI002724FF47|nr:transposase [Undibacterium sp.]MDO8654754.1 transposase [Undibacterium sp.]